MLLYELKDGMNRYLATRQGVPVRTLADVIGFNQRNADREMPFFGQELFEKAQAKGPLTDAAYVDAAQQARRLAREGIDQPLREHRLDAIVAPTGGPAWLTDHVNGDAFPGSSSTPAAVAGYPAITVPMGQARGPAGRTDLRRRRMERRQAAATRLRVRAGHAAPQAAGAASGASGAARALARHQAAARC